MLLKTKKNYYDGIPVTRVKGQGHGKYFLDLANLEDENDIVTSGSKEQITYLGGKSPINVKVVDPFKLRNAKFTLTISDSSKKFNHVQHVFVVFIVFMRVRALSVFVLLCSALALHYYA